MDLHVKSQTSASIYVYVKSMITLCEEKVFIICAVCFVAKPSYLILREVVKTKNQTCRLRPVWLPLETEAS